MIWYQKNYGNWKAEKYGWGNLFNHTNSYKLNSRFSDVHLILRSNND